MAARSAVEVLSLSSFSEGERGDAIHHVAELSPPCAAAVSHVCKGGDIGRKSSSRRGSKSNSIINGKSSVDSVPLPHSCPCNPSMNNGSCEDADADADAEFAQERRVVELLYRASEVIKEERARSVELQTKIDRLHQSTSVSPVIEKLQDENKGLKMQLISLRKELERKQTSDLLLENHGGGKSPLQHRGGDLCSAACTEKVSARSSAVGSSSTPPIAKVGAHRGHYSDAQHKKRQASSLQRQQMIASNEIRSCAGSIDIPKQRVRQTSAAECVSLTLPLETSAFVEEKTAASQVSTKNVAAGYICRGALLSQTNDKTYGMKMTTRLRRTMAPPPTKEQLGEVIHAMVEEVVRDTRRRGLELQLTRRAPCVYLCSCRCLQVRKGRFALPRTVHLSIVSGRLSVRVGGGHENFLDYLDRYFFFSQKCARA